MYLLQPPEIRIVSIFLALRDVWTIGIKLQSCISQANNRRVNENCPRTVFVQVRVRSTSICLSRKLLCKEICLEYCHERMNWIIKLSSRQLFTAIIFTDTWILSIVQNLVCKRHSRRSGWVWSKCYRCF